MKLIADLNQKIEQFVKETRDSEAIKVKSFVSVFYSGRWMMIVLVLVFLVLGIVWGVTSPKEYTTISKVLTEDNDGISSNVGLGNLSALMGVNSRNMAPVETLTPDLYPMIVTNNDFLLQLARDEYYFDGLDTTISLVSFFSTFEKENWIKSGVKFITKLPVLLTNQSKNSNKANLDVARLQIDSKDSLISDKRSQILSITAAEISAVSKLQNRIVVTKLNKVIELSTEMPDADVSAILNKKIIDYLISYVTKYKTDKERQNNVFIHSQLEEAEASFYKSQQELAGYQDENIGFVRERDKSVVQRLQTELRLATEVYTNLSQQLELSKIKLEQSKPILTIFEHPKVPISPSSTSIFGSVLAFVVLGFFFSIVSIVGRILWEFFKQA